MISLSSLLTVVVAVLGRLVLHAEEDLLQQIQREDGESLEVRGAAAAAAAAATSEALRTKELKGRSDRMIGSC